MHFKEWFSHPVAHVEARPSAGAYGTGWVHPLVFTVALYAVVGVVRWIIKSLKGMFKKSSDD